MTDLQSLHSLVERVAQLEAAVSALQQQVVQLQARLRPYECAGAVAAVQEVLEA